MKKRFHLSFYFTAVIFGIMAASFLVISPLALFAMKRGLFNTLSLFVGIALIYGVSVIVGVCLSAIVGRRILNPVIKFSEAARKIAGGDFSVRMEEGGKIHELSQMATDFNRMAQELGNTETFRGDFIANISHEFKTPLSSIEGYATLLASDSLTDAEKSEYVDRILASTRRLSTLSGNILKISQLESREIITDKKLFHLDEQLRQAVLLLEPKWTEKNLDMNIELDDAVYFGNEELLMQVWVNILSNAIKFTPEGGNVTVSLQRDFQKITISVSDSGIGMDEETMRHAFDKFYQADTSRKSEGNGLGLTLAMRIVTLCGGTIKAASVPGSGSVFTVALPLNP